MCVQATDSRLTIEPGGTAGMMKLTVSYNLAITENFYKSNWLVYVDVLGGDFAGDDEGPGYASNDILYAFTFPDSHMDYYVIKADGPTRKIPMVHTVDLSSQVLNEDPGYSTRVITFPSGKQATIRLPHRDEIFCRIRTMNVGFTNQVTLSL